MLDDIHTRKRLRAARWPCRDVRGWLGGCLSSHKIQTELEAAVERAEHRLKLAKKKVAEFYADNDPKDPRNDHANRYCEEIIREAETTLSWAKHKLANSE